MLRSDSGSVLGEVAPRGGRSYLTISLRRLFANRVGVICLSIIVLMYGAGLFAPIVTPYGYNDQDLTIAKQPSSFSHPLGTDRLGRDILTRVIYGLRTTVILTVVTLTTGTLALGITLGLLAGYFGRMTDTIIMRVGEIITSFPDIFLVLIIVLTVRPPMVEWLRGVEHTLGIKFVHLGIADYFALGPSALRCFPGSEWRGWSEGRCFRRVRSNTWTPPVPSGAEHPACCSAICCPM